MSRRSTLLVALAVALLGLAVGLVRAPVGDLTRPEAELGDKASFGLSVGPGC